MKIFSLILLSMMTLVSFTELKKDEASSKKLIENLEEEFSTIINWIDENPERALSEFKKNRENSETYHRISNSSTANNLICRDRTIYFEFNFKPRETNFYGYTLVDNEQFKNVFTNYESDAFTIEEKNEKFQVKIEAKNSYINGKNSEKLKTLYVEGVGKLKSGSEYFFTLNLLKDEYLKI